jgi:hypothetical protein
MDIVILPLKKDKGDAGTGSGTKCPCEIPNHGKRN